ncbi:1-acyl-sn-glycerol-3-phosphate acyltransferase [Salinisphaera sp.]|uniref:1-acyl-sn-glycerol-3-phosphate acyltransferase n=1 Tax=Salinisphaera sp. TaxID=1914330 RepID=UPI002D77F710|nr:1-acyl-sn-glycerol-3-phosphate acyltransferase [Salinisphaera sp.]HET7314585.1 1-acyl-sn-glycerol-3-phosphate acyltransferase [Salinisphaera sp.]
MRKVSTILCSLYGVYAFTIWLIVIIIGGALLLVLPGLDLRRRVARRAIRLMLAASGIPYRFSHLDRLPDDPCVVIANHQSYLDGLVLTAALPPHFAPVIKRDMERVPIVGRVLARIGSRFVEREPAMAAGRDTLAILESLQAGQSIAIFPEGTFTPDRGLLPFRDGASFLAAKAGVPMVPVALRGTDKILPETGILPRPGRVTVDILEPATAEAADRAAADALRDRVEFALFAGLHPDAYIDHGQADSQANGKPRPTYDYYREAFADQALPFAYVDLDQLEAHIRSVLDIAANKPLRVDARVLRCPEIIERVMRANARFHGVKCATVDEALYLAGYSELNDFLVAFPVVQPAPVKRLCAAIGQGHGLTLTVDSTDTLDMLDETARAAEVELPLCVEIDTSAGIDDASPSRRSAVHDTKALVELARAIDARDNLSFRGVLIFDTQRQTRSGQDQRNGRHLLDARAGVISALSEAGLKPSLVDCGGIGELSFNANDPSVTEITVGAAFFGLADASATEAKSETPAAGYASEIMRRTDTQLYATLSGGYTAPDTRKGTTLPAVYLPRAAELDDLAGAGAGQLPIFDADNELCVGAPVFMRPANASELCERFDRLVLMQDGAIVGHARTYRAIGDQFGSQPRGASDAV